MYNEEGQELNYERLLEHVIHGVCLRGHPVPCVMRGVRRDCKAVVMVMRKIMEETGGLPTGSD